MLNIFLITLLPQVQAHSTNVETIDQCQLVTEYRVSSECYKSRFDFSIKSVLLCISDGYT
jgi:hypothetical protein